MMPTKMIRNIVIIIAAMALAGCGGGGGGGGDRVTTTPTCTTHSTKACSDGNVYWYDSCGVKEDAYDVCEAAESCTSGQCVLQSVTWLQTAGGTSSDTGEAVATTSDYGYVIAGGSRSYTSGAVDYFVAKLNYAGVLQWQVNYGGTDFDVAKSVIQTSDGGYAVVGYTLSQGSGLADGWLIKLDSSGAKSWEKLYGGTLNDYIVSIKQTSDGGFIAVGYTYSQGSGSADMWVLKLNSIGSTTWAKVTGGAGIDVAEDVVQASDGGYAVAGYTESEGAGLSDLKIIKLDASGNISWQQVFGGTSEDRAYAIVQAADGGYAAAGFTGSYGNGEYDFWIVKTTSSGTESWKVTNGGADYDSANDIAALTDGSFIVAGYTESYGSGNEDVRIIKLDSTGNQLWAQNYGGTNNDLANSVAVTADGGIVAAGYTASFGSGNEDFWILKLNSSGTE